MNFYASETYKDETSIEIAGQEFADLTYTEGSPDLSAGGVIAGVDFTPTATVANQTFGIIDSTVDLANIESGYGFDGGKGYFENTTIQNAVKGAVFLNDGTYTFKDVTFQDNKNSTNNLGGAIYAKGNTTIIGGKFVNNTTTSHGGAIYNTNAKYTLTVTGTEFIRNNSV